VSIGLPLLAAVAAGYLGWQHFAQPRPGAQPAPPPPVPVIATTVQQRDFPIVLSGVGNVMALNSATVHSMITEPILSIDFKDGQFVRKGDLLAQLDPSTYQSRLDQAEANLARDQAHLENAQTNLTRYVPLEKQGFAPERQVTTQQAQIAQLEATIKADQAVIEYAKSSSVTRNWWRPSTVSLEFACSMSATSFIRARRGVRPANRMRWW
jgi:membrane fusion protein, multidrug efflux system